MDEQPDRRPPRGARIGRPFHGGWLVLLGAIVTVAWLVNLSHPGTRVEGCTVGCARAQAHASVTASDDTTLRVMSLNVLHGFPRFEHLRQRLDRIAGEIRRQEVDIACLQEVPWTPHLGSAARYLARETGMNHIYLRANGNRWAILFEEGEAILSRYPLRQVAFRELGPRASLFEHRVVLRATAITPGGEVTVYVTHLTHGDPEVNRAQLASLVAYVTQAGDGPSIVAGDLNATEDVLQVAAADWLDTFRVARPDDPGYTCCVDDLSAKTDCTLAKRIDYVFWVSGAEAVRVADSRRALNQAAPLDGGWLWASDHVGVLTTLAVE